MSLINLIYGGVLGCHKIDSALAGPVVGVLCLTHGNEIAGLHACNQLIEEIEIGTIPLKKGSIVFIAVNLDAHCNFMKSGDYSIGRFVDINMNRIGQFMNQTNSSEYKRFHELSSIFNELDVVIDIHSVSTQGNDLIAICDTRYKDIVSGIVDSDFLLLDDDLKKGGSLISILNSHGILGYGIECGQHDSTIAHLNAIINVKNLLKHYKMIDGDIQQHYKLKAFKFLEEIIPNSTDFTFSKERSNFECIGKEEIYALEGNKVYPNFYPHNVYIGIVHKNIIPGDGAGFLFELIK